MYAIICISRHENGGEEGNIMDAQREAAMMMTVMKARGEHRERDKEGTTAAKMREDLLLLKMDRCAKAAGDNQPASLPFFSNFFLQIGNVFPPFTRRIGNGWKK